MSATKIIFNNPKSYKGRIKYSKGCNKTKFWIDKLRPFGVKSYAITSQEYEWCDSRKKAENLWHFKHMIGTAYWFSGDLANPMTGETYSETPQYPNTEE